MDIRLLVKKLRNAADSLDDLFVNEKNENETTAKKIINSRKGKSYNGKHWTQLPENKAKLSRAMKQMWRKKNG